MPRRTLDRFLSRSGAASRTEAATLIESGRVAVNGRRVFDPGQWIDPDRDEVTLDGERVTRTASRVALFNKPRGVLVTRHDPQGRPTVTDTLPAPFSDDSALKPVGRLDQASAGLLLFVTDTDLGARLLDPEHHVAKRYRVKLRPAPSESGLEAWREGMEIGDSTPTLPAEVEVERLGEKSGVVTVTLVEGRNRQIRRMAEATGAEVEWLVRTHFGPLELGDLPPGEARWATAEERAALERASRG